MFTNLTSYLRTRYHHHEPELWALTGLLVGVVAWYFAGTTTAVSLMAALFALSFVVSTNVTPRLPTELEVASPVLLAQLDQLCAKANSGRVNAFVDPALGEASYITLRSYDADEEDLDIEDFLALDEDDYEVADLETTSVRVLANFRASIRRYKQRSEFRFSEGVTHLDGPSEIFVALELASQVGRYRHLRELLVAAGFAVLATLNVVLTSTPRNLTLLGVGFFGLFVLYPLLKRRAVLAADSLASAWCASWGIVTLTTMLLAQANTTPVPSLLRRLVSPQPTPGVRVAALLGQMNHEQLVEFRSAASALL